MYIRKKGFNTSSLLARVLTKKEKVNQFNRLSDFFQELTSHGVLYIGLIVNDTLSYKMNVVWSLQVPR